INVIYVGTPLHLCYGSTGDRQVLYIDDKINHIKFKTLKKLLHSFSYEEFMNFNPDTTISTKIKLSLTLLEKENKEVMSKIKSMEKMGVYVVVSILPNKSEDKEIVSKKWVNVDVESDLRDFILKQDSSLL